ncbi:MAG: protein-glutamate O-methyltransferase CheR [Phycisphaerae bacterium]|nr:protein-glutamate O-methyltransferase CheR [Phycisphaerae bacterium]
MAVVKTLNTDISDAQFEQISALVKNLAGINLHDGKKELVKARLAKRCRQLKLQNLDQYISLVKNDKTGQELISMLDALSTNLTFFFRESQHFTFLRDTVLPKIVKRGDRQLRIWSAGCSSGEEPYSISMLLNESIQSIGNWDVRILATDLSTRVLAIACSGEYSQQRFKETPRQLVSRYFEVVREERPAIFKAKPEIRDLIHFARLNLMEDWPMKGPFDVIFCRNVMIYFDKPTQSRLINRYYDLLADGGYLFLGHSESLTGTKHTFKYVQPATYMK